MLSLASLVAAPLVAPGLLSWAMGLIVSIIACSRSQRGTKARKMAIAGLVVAISPVAVLLLLAAVLVVVALFDDSFLFY